MFEILHLLVTYEIALQNQYTLDGRLMETEDDFVADRLERKYRQVEVDACLARKNLINAIEGLTECS